MLGIIWHFIDISIPWEVKLVAAAVIIGVLLALFRTYWKYILAAGAILGAGVLLNRAKQQGYAARKADEDIAAKKAETVVAVEKDKAKNETDAQLNQETDKWTRG